VPSELNPEVPPVWDGVVLSMLTKEPDDPTTDVGTIRRGLRRLEEELGERPAATARPAEIPAAIKAVPLTAIDRRETRLEMREPDCAALVVVIAVATWVSVLWPYFSVQILATKSAFAVAAEQSSAIGPPISENLANGQSTSLAAVPAASAKVTVATATLESEPSVGAVATSPVVKTAPHSTMTRVKQPRAKTSGVPPPKPATLTLAVSPWAAVYIDGKFHGTTPPVTTLALTPGRHLVEVRNSTQPPYLTYATVRAGEVRSIRHEFENGHDLR
jgi:eukaryotic-like serine/threonine-protein kinase